MRDYTETLIMTLLLQFLLRATTAQIFHSASSVNSMATNFRFLVPLGREIDFSDPNHNAATCAIHCHASPGCLTFCFGRHINDELGTCQLSNISIRVLIDSGDESWIQDNKFICYGSVKTQNVESQITEQTAATKPEHGSTKTESRPTEIEISTIDTEQYSTETGSTDTKTQSDTPDPAADKSTTDATTELIQRVTSVVAEHKSTTDATTKLILAITKKAIPMTKYILCEDHDFTEIN